MKDLTPAIAPARGHPVASKPLNDGVLQFDHPAHTGPSASISMGWTEIERLEPTVEIDIAPAVRWENFGKVIFDFSMALLILIPALPIIGFCYAAIRMSSRGPGFYTQTRLGLNGREYRIIKLRTMILDSEVHGAAWAAKNDVRITRLGKFLRITHFDELPQLFNVLRGEMSLVGPRPERPEMIAKKGLNQVVPGYSQRLVVKPGVTGLAQVQLPADTDIVSVRRKVVYDFYYIENASLWFDLRIMGATLLKSFVGPQTLRRLFLLPSRSDVTVAFRRKAAPDQSHSGQFPEFVPA
jgi:lipopolysaccharide/colanic/teichoic acid biosynthesis glycosyltransferase